MTKRVSLSERRAGDAKGIDAIIQGTAEPAAASKSETVVPDQPQTDSEAVPTSPGKPSLSKVTIYIRLEQVIAVESIQLAERQRTGQKPDKSDLVQEALDLLIEKYRLL